MSKPSLRSRLFRAHLIVLAIGILTLTAVGWLYTPRLFVLRLRRIEGQNFRMAQVQGQLVEVFQFAWGRGMLWAALLGGISASSLSYWLSQRVDRKSTRLNSSHRCISYAVFCLKQKI